LELIEKEIRDLLEQRADYYNNIQFIESDPISIPHTYTKKEDIEIAAILTATIAWGQRKTIIQNARLLLKRMDDQPFDFIMHAAENDLKSFINFRYRTFSGFDCIYFIQALQQIYRKYGGLEVAFTPASPTGFADMKDGIIQFRNYFLELPCPANVPRHIANPAAGSAAKRINMFLRWMVRRDKRGVDFGLWTAMSPKQLLCPLDVHSARVARKLGLLSRNQDDWKAVIELTENLRFLDPEDPVKYDFALFGLGIYENYR
jgi:uncharacterized protein (TIGR02757 family)